MDSGRPPTRPRGFGSAGAEYRPGPALAACWLAMGLLAAAAAQARPATSVQVKVRPDGTRFIYNESVTQRTRRMSTHLVTPQPGIAELIDFYSRRHNLNPRLVRALIQVESGYNPDALSSQGAIGLMQLMPDTAKLMGVEDAWDPEQNIRAGTRYLRQQLERFSNLSLALAAYNAGPTAVAEHQGIPPYRETRDYVRKVVALLGSARSAVDRQPELAGEADPPEAESGPAAAESQGGGESRVASRKAASPLPGNKVYLVRRENNRIFVTTAPPKSQVPPKPQVPQKSQ